MKKGLHKACILLASLEEKEVKEVMNYLTEEEKRRIKEGIFILGEKKANFILGLMGKNYGY